MEMTFDKFVEMNEAKKRKVSKNPAKTLAMKNKKMLQSIADIKAKGKNEDPAKDAIQKLKMKKFKLDIQSNELQIEIYNLQK